MLKKILSSVFVLSLLCDNLVANTSVYFSPDPANETRIVSIINSAKQTIDMAAFSLTLDSVADALIKAHQRGVKVRLLLDKQQTSVKKADYKRLESAGIPVKVDQKSGLMHNKFIIVDSVLVQTGSFNYTDNAVKNNYENLVFIDDGITIEQFMLEFERMWKDN
ncbi:MAG: phospholipase D family protein [Nitrososphaerales archaeon]